jgi:hypothetical protein
METSRMPKNFLVEYPNFLKPTKAYASRRTNDTHVKTAMNDALKRYEKELLEMEKSKKKSADEFLLKLRSEA